MTEIRIEKKKPVWPWVVLVLIILAVIYFFWYNNDRNLDNSEDLYPLTDTISRTDGTNRNEWGDTLDNLNSGNYGLVRSEQTLADYFSFVDNTENRTSDQGYYRTGFFSLISAVKRQSEIEMVDVSQHISSAMESAENLTNDQTSTTTADNAKKAAEEVAKALRKIQEKEYDNLSEDAKELDDAVAGIDAAQNLDQESEELDTFFEKAARLLQKMNDNGMNN